MNKLTKSDIAEKFELGELAKEFFDNTVPSSFEIVEKREREFIDKVLKPWIELILKGEK